MAQIRFTSTGNLSDSVLLDTDPDLTVGSGDVLVQMEAATINPVDFLFAAGQYGIPAVPGQPIGTEGVGRVVSVGADVDRELVGARVIFLGTAEQGTWAHQTVVPARNVVRVGEGTDAAQLAQLSINPLTAHVLLTRYGNLKPGSWIGQTLGNGAVGTFAVKIAKQAGFKTLSIVRSPEAAAQVKANGGDIVVLAGDGLGDRISAELDGVELDLVIDGEGGSNVGELARSLRFGGTVVAYSAVTGLLPAVGLGDLAFREVSLTGWWFVNWIRNTPKAEIEATYAELEALLVAGIISSPVEASYPLEEFREAIEHSARSGRRGKIIFDLTL